MKSQMNRKTFLQATLATTFTGLAACSGEEDGTAGDGDGDMSSGGSGPGTGGAGTGGAGTGGGATGGAGTGGAGTGGGATGGAGTGGAGTGGAGTGGSSAGGSDTGGSGTGGDAGGGCAAVMTEWADNHDPPGEHDYDEMEVSAADVTAGVEKVYNVQGASQHPHTLTVTAQDFADLAANGMVEVTTSEEFGHDHVVILTCSM